MTGIDLDLSAVRPPKATSDAWNEALNTVFRDAYRLGHDEGYSLGFEDGAEKMRQSILNAASAPKPDVKTVALSLTSTSSMNASAHSTRAARGAVGTAIKAVLSLYPDGLTETELGLAAARYDRSVSPKSVGGELNRKRDRLYRSVGGRWFLISQEKKETAGVDPAVPSTSTQEAPDGTSGTAIAA